MGSVMENLEERNEMSETPLIREAADGNARNVLLLLEAGADVNSQQMNNIGFTAMNQAGQCCRSVRLSC
jgi:ankyrin repeat protein